jgi:alpha-beta hydrolase superfamily lysophospholipase
MGSVEKYRAIKKEDRSAYIKEKLELKQMEGPPPLLFIKEFTDSGKFTYEKYELHYYCIKQTENPKAIVVHVHGMNSHGGTCGYYASVITNKNPEVNFYSFDQMNFGRSAGPFRGEIASFEDTLKQLDTFLEYILGTLKSKPKIFLSGSSYGGTVIFKASLMNPEKYAGLLLLAPAIRNLS